MLANLEICDKCIQEDMAIRAEKAHINGKVTTKVLYNGAYLACPLYVGRLDLTEAKKMPAKCRYKMEHIIVNQSKNNVK
jgi:hypothetical protein